MRKLRPVSLPAARCGNGSGETRRPPEAGKKKTEAKQIFAGGLTAPAKRASPQSQSC
jgi:hypothetical protein